MAGGVRVHARTLVEGDPASSLSPFPPSRLCHPGCRRSLPCLGHPPPCSARKTHPARTPPIRGPATTTWDSTETMAAAGTKEATNATSRTQDASRARVAIPYVRARDASRTTSSQGVLIHWPPMWPGRAGQSSDHASDNFRQVAHTRRIPFVRVQTGSGIYSVKANGHTVGEWNQGKPGPAILL